MSLQDNSRHIQHGNMDVDVHKDKDMDKNVDLDVILKTVLFWTVFLQSEPGLGKAAKKGPF